MKVFPQLNFPACKFKVRSSASDDIYVWDIIRNKWLLLTPEEWVRQHVIYWLINELHIPKTSIVCEYPVNINGLSQRADIVVFENSTPSIVVECKAPEIKVDRSVFDQIGRYNSVIEAPCVIITNGLNTIYYGYKGGIYRQIRSIR